MSTIANLLKHPLIELDQIAKWVTGHGSWSFLPHEQLVVDAAITSLPSNVQNLINRQLAQRYFVDRVGGAGRINDIWFDDPDPVLKIPVPEFEEKTIRVFLKVDGKRQRTLVKFFEGYISTIQLPKVRKFYKKAKVFEVLKVKGGKDDETYELAIDRLEHGRDPEC